MLHIANDLEASQKDGIEDFLDDSEISEYETKTKKLMHELSLAIGDESNGNIISAAEGGEYFAKVQEVRDDWKVLVESKWVQMKQHKYHERIKEADLRKRERELKEKVSIIMQARKNLKDCTAAGRELEESLAQR